MNNIEDKRHATIEEARFEAEERARTESSVGVYHVYQFEDTPDTPFEVIRQEVHTAPFRKEKGRTLISTFLFGRNGWSWYGYRSPRKSSQL